MGATVPLVSVLSSGEPPGSEEVGKPQTTDGSIGSVTVEKFNSKKTNKTKNFWYVVFSLVRSG